MKSYSLKRKRDALRQISMLPLQPLKPGQSTLWGRKKVENDLKKRSSSWQVQCSLVDSTSRSIHSSLKLLSKSRRSFVKSIKRNLQTSKRNGKLSNKIKLRSIDISNCYSSNETSWLHWQLDWMSEMIRSSNSSLKWMHSKELTKIRKMRY